MNRVGGGYLNFIWLLTYIVLILYFLFFYPCMCV
nr:MAG TPA: chitin synthase regulator [Caudoviricetes sp.]